VPRNRTNRIQVSAAIRSQLGAWQDSTSGEASACYRGSEENEQEGCGGAAADAATEGPRMREPGLYPSAISV